jgi:hypothetical protein
VFNAHALEQNAIPPVYSSHQMTLFARWMQILILFSTSIIYPLVATRKQQIQVFAPLTLANVQKSRSPIKTSLQNLSIANAALKLASSATQSTTTSTAIPKQTRFCMIRSLQAAISKSQQMPATSSSSLKTQVEAAARSKAESAFRSSEASSAMKMVPLKSLPSKQPNATCPNARGYAKSVTFRTAAIAALFHSSNSMNSTMAPTRGLTA